MYAHSNRLFLITTCAVLCVATGRAAWAQSLAASGPWNNSSNASQVQSAINQALKANNIPGAAVSISQGHAQWVTTAGVADVATGAAPDARTDFAYRSITKSFVSTVILQLAGAGLLNLDDPVSKYVSGVPDGRQITIRDLAEMRSGLFNYSASAAFQAALNRDPGKAWTPQELLSYGFSEPMQFTPGTSYQYSNTNTVLLGQVITAITGNSWNQAIANRLAGPLGLSSITYPGANTLPDSSAQGYVDAGEGPEPVSIFNATIFDAAGGLYGTIGDLALWGKALGTGATLSEADYVARMKSFGSTSTDPKSPEYDSYGFNIGEISGWIGHTGTGLGFQSLVMYDPLNDRTIAILFNASNDNPDAPADLFLTLLRVLGWTAPTQTQVTADHETISIGSSVVWTGLVSGPFNARAPLYAVDGGTAIATGPIQIATLGLYVPAIYVGQNASVVLAHGGTIAASRGGDGADVYGGHGTASLSLSGVTIHLQGDTVTGTGIDVADHGSAALSDVQIIGTALAGLHAGGRAASAISGSDVTITLGSGLGVWSTGHGAVTLRDSNVTVQGSGYGAVAQGAGASIALTNSKIITHGSGAHGVVLSDGASVALIGSSVETTGADAVAVAALSTEQGNASAERPTGSALSQLLLSTSSLSDANGIAILANDNLSVDASASQIIGAVMTSDDMATYLDLKNGSLWVLPSAAAAAASSLHTLVNQNSSIAFTPPASATGPYQKLTVHDYAGDDAVIAMNAFLGTNSAASDQLVIDGGSATGTTTLILHSMGGAALTSGDGLRVVETENGGQTDPASFLLGGRVASGAYDYNLYRGGATGGNDWFLSSQLPGKPTLPDIRPEVPVDMALPAMAGRYGLAALGSFNAREDARMTADLTGSDQGAYWSRAFGEAGAESASNGAGSSQLQRFDHYGPRYSFGLAGVEVGVDLLAHRSENDTKNIGGIFIGGGSVTASVDGVYGSHAGKASMNAYSLGGYWTRIAAEGWYVDATIQGTFYGQANTTSIYNQSIATSGWGLISSLEVGYPIAIGPQWDFEPQAQAIYQHIGLADTQDSYGSVGYGPVDTGYGRVGGRINRKWDLENGHQLSSWLETNLWQAMGDDIRASFSDRQGTDPTSFSSETGGPSLEFGIGLAAQPTSAITVAGSVDYAKQLGLAAGQRIGGAVNITMMW